MEPPKNANVFDLKTSIMWFDEDGIVCSVSKKIPTQTLEDSKKGVADFKKIIGNKKVCLLADVTNSSETTREVRDYAAIELPKLVKAVAMISKSALGRMLANMFFSIKEQPYPVKMFSDEADAKKWLKKFL